MEQTMALPDTRNQVWANDKSKFGYKMLQKMGWTEGKGLGVKEDGTTENIRVRRKTRNLGLGSETGRDDWSKPAQAAAGLNDVLARLAPINCDTPVVRAEKVAKKGRGYFERRSAGKNVSAYSEKDLKEIFGGINVERNTELGSEGQDIDAVKSPGEEERAGQKGKPAEHVQRSAEKREDDAEAVKSKRRRDEGTKQRNALDKEKRKKAKRKSLAPKATIKKVKKTKKSRRKERS